MVKVDDLSPLTEIAPSHAIVLDILCYAWLNSMTVVEDKLALASLVDETIQTLVSSFTSTDAVTLLEFLGTFLRQADSAVGYFAPFFRLESSRLADYTPISQVDIHCGRVHTEAGRQSANP